MRIVSLNSWKNDGDYARRLPLILDGLAALAPDIICLQEAFAGGGADTAAWLAAELGYGLHAAPARRKLRSHGGREVDSTSGLAILARGAFTGAAIDLPTDPRDGQRIAQRLDLSLDGRPLRILNLHLTHLRGLAAAELRGRQLDAALAWAREGLTGGLVVAGDLNAPADAPELAALGLESGLATLHGARAGLPRGGAIDHCRLLHPGAWRCVGQVRGLETPDAEGWYPSDHAAVGLDLA